MAELNLKERVELLKERFKDVKLSVYRLALIYKMSGIKMKLNQVKKGNSEKYPEEEVQELSMKAFDKV
jgi:hypothetical protein